MPRHAHRTQVNATYGRCGYRENAHAGRAATLTMNRALRKPNYFDQRVAWPIRTLLTERLGISHPILLAPMDVVADARLTSAVSAAGGLGILGGAYGDEQWLSRELDILSNSRARFGVGFITWSMAKQPKLLDLVLERKPAVGG